MSIVEEILKEYIKKDLDQAYSDLDELEVKLNEISTLYNLKLSEVKKHEDKLRRLSS